MSEKIKIILLATFTLTSLFGLAQGPPIDGDLFEDINDVPIDGAIALLTAAGVAIGIKKLYNRKK